MDCAFKALHLAATTVTLLHIAQAELHCLSVLSIASFFLLFFFSSRSLRCCSLLVLCFFFLA
jgi:hypothetical protein